MVAVENGSNSNSARTLTLKQSTHSKAHTHINNNGILAVPLLKPHQLQQIF
jgi:hypothetical protein